MQIGLKILSLLILILGRGAHLASHLLEELMNQLLKGQKYLNHLKLSLPGNQKTLILMFQRGVNVASHALGELMNQLQKKQKYLNQPRLPSQRK